jgi:hypothetical protein
MPGCFGLGLGLGWMERNVACGSCALCGNTRRAACRLLKARYIELGQLADKCLMTLKMEARCQCYYYITIFLQKVRHGSLMSFA